MIVDFHGFRSGWRWTGFGGFGCRSWWLGCLWLRFGYGLVRGAFSLFDFEWLRFSAGWVDYGLLQAGVTIERCQLGGSVSVFYCVGGDFAWQF